MYVKVLNNKVLIAPQCLPVNKNKERCGEKEKEAGNTPEDRLRIDEKRFRVPELLVEIKEAVKNHQK